MDRDIAQKARELLKGRFVVTAEGIEELRALLKKELGGGVKDGEIERLVHEECALGKLTPLFLSEDLEEIMVIGAGTPVFVFHRKKGMTKTDVALEEGEAREIIQRIARYSGRAVDGGSPLLDGRLPDGSRANATLPEVSPRGPTLTIRMFREVPLTIADLVRHGTLDLRLAAFLWLVVEGLRFKPANILIVGGTASGKTTTLNALSSFVPEGERIVSIEDTMEINLKHEHWIPMETKPSEPGKKNEVTMDALLKNALRMRPDRIIVGEVRGEEAMTLFTAMNTGHDGCMATVHANSAREALTRLQNHPMNVPDVMIPALDLLVAQKRTIDGGKLVRRVFEVAEIGGREGGNILTNTLFKHDPKTGQLEMKILNGRIIQDLAAVSGKSIKEIDEEMGRRKVILEGIIKAGLSHGEIHSVVQQYYKNPDEAVELIYNRAAQAKK